MAEFTRWEVRRIHPKPGRRGWVIMDTRRKDFYALPKGLLDGTLVSVISVTNDWARVRAQGGKEFEVHAWHHLDMGRNYCIEGSWVREDDPRVLDAWERCLTEMRALPVLPGPHGRERWETIMKLGVLLARHGRDRGPIGDAPSE